MNRKDQNAKKHGIFSKKEVADGRTSASKFVKTAQADLIKSLGHEPDTTERSIIRSLAFSMLRCWQIERQMLSVNEVPKRTLDTYDARLRRRSMLMQMLTDHKQTPTGTKAHMLNVKEIDIEPEQVHAVHELLKIIDKKPDAKKVSEIIPPPAATTHGIAPENLAQAEIKTPEAATNAVEATEPERTKPPLVPCNFCDESFLTLEEMTIHAKQDHKVIDLGNWKIYS